MATTRIQYACVHQAISALTGIVAVPSQSQFVLEGDLHSLADKDEFELVPATPQPGEYPCRTFWTAEGSPKILPDVDQGVVGTLIEIWPALKDKPWVMVGNDVLCVRAHPSCPEIKRKIINQYCEVERHQRPNEVRKRLVELWRRVEPLADAKRMA